MSGLLMAARTRRDTSRAEQDDGRHRPSDANCVCQHARSTVKRERPTLVLEPAPAVISRGLTRLTSIADPLMASLAMKKASGKGAVGGALAGGMVGSTSLLRKGLAG